MEFILRSKTCSRAFEDISKKTGNFSLDFRVISTDATLARLWPQLAQELFDHPEITLSILSLAMHQVLSLNLIICFYCILTFFLILKKLMEITLLKLVLVGTRIKFCKIIYFSKKVLLDKVKTRFRRKSDWKSNQFICSPIEIPYQLRARIGHYDKYVEFRHIRAGLYGKLVVIRGNVIRTGPILALCLQLTFSCRTCHGVFSHLQPEGIFTQPSRCPMNTGNRLQCTGSSFQVLRRSSKNIMLEFQTVRVQEDNATESNSVIRLKYMLLSFFAFLRN